MNSDKSSFIPPAAIGFVGLGNMGYPMARRLAEAGYVLTVFDLASETVTQFCQETGATAADSLEALGIAADIVITMLPEGKAVRKVLLGEGDNVVAGLKDGAVLIDMSSCSPVDTRVLSKEMLELGFPIIDAPVSGGKYKAADGQLAIMAGGEKDLVESCSPVFEVMGKVFHTGGPASGHAMKAMNNFLSAGTLALASEAMITGSKFGLDPQVMVDIINASTGRSNSTEDKFPKFILPRTFNSGFYLGLMAKDLRFAVDLAASENTPNNFINLLSSTYDKAEEALGFDSDNTELFKYLESLAEED
ncbi:MAG: NAD(P)-dependent oxidoreductase [Gammaproteobacteria bacterium]|nr:NAD(P)-dependent oxidoreductase [Gammaproteobacteria bacterium]